MSDAQREVLPPPETSGQIGPGLAEPRLAVRLTTFLASAVLLMVLVYMFVSHRQRQALMMESVTDQVDLITSVIASAADDLLTRERFAELDDLLTSTARADVVFAAIVLDAVGVIRAGGATDLPCLQRSLPSRLPPTRASGRSDCGNGVRWGATPLAPHGGWLIVALEEVLVVQASGDALQRQLLLLLALASTFGVTLVIVQGLEQRLERAERFATIGRLSGGLAHELGSPLSVIGLRAGAILQRTKHDDAVHEEAQAITLEVARVTAFIEGLLHLARRRGVRFTLIDANTVVQSAATDMENLARDGKTDIRLALPAEHVRIRGDKTLLAHAVRNVLRNAIQAVRGRAGPRRVDISLQEQLQNVLIVVEDNGPGIPADKFMQVFEPFVTTKPAEMGIGLGLSISKGIIQEHGGDVWIQNATAGGARVTIRLPLASPIAEASR